MAWCRQATSHYLSQCWHSSMSHVASLDHNELTRLVMPETMNEWVMPTPNRLADWVGISHTTWRLAVQHVTAGPGELQYKNTNASTMLTFCLIFFCSSSIWACCWAFNDAILSSRSFSFILAVSIRSFSRSCWRCSNSHSRCLRRSCISAKRAWRSASRALRRSYEETRNKNFNIWFKLQNFSNYE